MKWLDEDTDVDLIDEIHNLMGDQLWKLFGAAHGVKKLCTDYGLPALYDRWNGSEFEDNNEIYAEMVILANETLNEV